MFMGTDIAITTEGKRHLGAAIRSPTFVERYVQKKVSGWVKEMETLSSMAASQPHSAYAAFTHGLSHRWTYLVRTIPDVSDLLKPLEDVIRHKFLPAEMPSMMKKESCCHCQYALEVLA